MAASHGKQTEDIGERGRDTRGDLEDFAAAGTITDRPLASNRQHKLKTRPPAKDLGQESSGPSYLRASSFSTGTAIAPNDSRSRSLSVSQSRPAPLGSTIQPSPTQLPEPDDCSAHEEYQRYLQRQFQHKLRTIERPGPSLLSKFKGPLLRSSVSSSSTPSPANPSSSVHPSTSHPHDSDFNQDTSSGVMQKEPSSGTRKKGLPIEQSEISQDVLIWQGDGSSLASNNSPSFKGSFAPKVTRKLAKYGSVATQRLPTGSPTTTPSDSGRFKSFSPAKLKEKPSRMSLQTSAGHFAGTQGSWKNGRITLREDKVLYILEGNGVLLYPLRAKLLKSTDVRPVHESVFSRYHVMGIYALPSNFAGGRQQASSSQSSDSAHSTSTPASPAVQQRSPIYICFPSFSAMGQWIQLLRICGTPEVFGSTSSIVKGGTHRWHRQIDITVWEFRSHAPSVAFVPLTSSDRAAMAAASVDSVPDVPTSSASSRDEDGSTDTYQSFHVSLERSISSVSQRSESSAAQHTGGSDRFETDSDEEEDAATGPIVGGSRSSLLPPTNTDTKVRPHSSRRQRDTLLPSGTASSAVFSCTVFLDDLIVGQTDARASSEASGSIFWPDSPITVKNLPVPQSLRIELICWLGGVKASKRQVIGFVDLPVDSMRRDEDIEGWFSVWSFRGSNLIGDMRGVTPSQSSFAEECIGEIKLHLKFQETAVMHSRKYSEVEELVNRPDCPALISSLCRLFDENHIIERLVEIYTASGTITDRLCEMVEAESLEWQPEQPELLFRANTLLSRSLDKFQRMHCRQWLDSCVGDLVREICWERIKVNSDLTDWVGGSTVAADESGQHQREDTTSLPLDRIKDFDNLQYYASKLWERIYSNRHSCPPDLRSILSKVRQSVTARFGPNQGYLHALQGVGSFVFLRFICPAIRTPQLYGLTTSPPDDEVSNTLLLLAKIILALITRRGMLSHQQHEKASWLNNFTPFLQLHSSSSDDFILHISSFDSTIDAAISPPLNDDSRNMQRSIESMLPNLPSLHRETIALSPYLIDKQLALAKFVSCLGGASRMYPQERADGSSVTASGNRRSPDDSNLLRGNSHLDNGTQIAHRLIAACCEAQSLLGYYIDKAGFASKPLMLYPLAWQAGSQHSPISTVATGKTAAPSAMRTNAKLHTGPRWAPVREESSTPRRRQTLSAGVPRADIKSRNGEQSTTTHGGQRAHPSPNERTSSLDLIDLPPHSLLQTQFSSPRGGPPTTRDKFTRISLDASSNLTYRPSSGFPSRSSSIIADEGGDAHGVESMSQASSLAGNLPPPQSKNERPPPSSNRGLKRSSGDAAKWKKPFTKVGAALKGHSKAKESQ